MESLPGIRFTNPIAMLACLAFASVAKAGVLYSENFETVPLGPEWSLVNSGTGRARVTSEFEPIEGKQHLVLDDSVNDAVAAPAQAILRVNLSNRKNLVLQYRLKSLGNEPDWPFGGPASGPALYDGVSISTNEGATWTLVGNLLPTGTETITNQIQLDGYLFQFRRPLLPDLLIRFSEFDNASAPIDGLAIDAIEITGDPAQSLQIELPDSVREGSGPYTGYVLLAYPADVPTPVSLSTPAEGDLVAPASITIPAGQTFASFEFSVKDDTLINLARPGQIEASIPGVRASVAYLGVHDNERLGIRLEMPASLAEGGAAAALGRVVLDRPADVPLSVTLIPDPYGRIEMPPIVDVPQGATEVTFPVQARENIIIDGTMVVTVSASIPDVPAATAQVRVEDNELRTIELSLNGPLTEGADGEVTIRLSGITIETLTVDLTNLTPDVVTVPRTIVLPAFSDAVTFAVKNPDNALRDGSRIARIAATAPLFAPASLSFTILDDELAAIGIVRSPDLVDLGGAGMDLEVSALDVEGRLVSTKNFAAAIEFVGADGTIVPATPGSLQVLHGKWTGQLNLPESPKSPLRLRITGPDGVRAETSPIETMRVLPFNAGDLVWDAHRERLYASLRSIGNGAEANQVVAIDPTTGEILARVQVASDPLRMAMTSGGEFLYAALDGSAKIARIDLDSFAVESTFRVGSSPIFGLFFAGDLQTVEGQPNRLIVCRTRKGISPSTDGVVVFDNGIAQPAATLNPIESNLIEPSADPTVFFGYNTESSESDMRILKLTGAGLTEVGSRRFPTAGCCVDLRSDGDVIFGSEGTIFDGPGLAVLGKFASGGAVCPDRAANRAYFIEPTDIFGSGSRLAAFDATSYARVAHLTLPSTLGRAASLVRWGKTGLAFRAGEAIAILRASSLIPTEPPADLQVRVASSEPELSPGRPIVYTVEVSNLGPNPVAGAAITARFTSLQSIQRVESDGGQVFLSENSVEVSAMAIAVGAKVTLKVTVLPQDRGTASCVAHVHSPAIDPVPANDAGMAFVSVGYRSTPNSVNVVPISGFDLLHDPGSGMLLVSGAPTAFGDDVTARSVMRVDPGNGWISQPIALNAQPSALALSSNGRYLYAGLTDVPAVQRIDLSSGLPDLRVPLGTDRFGDPVYAEDVEALAGDGTSFIASLERQNSSPGHAGVAVFDGAVRRPSVTQGHTGSNQIEPTIDPTLFIGLNNESTEGGVRTLQVDSSGVRETRVVENLAGGYSTDLAGDGDLMLTSAGNLIDGPSLALKVHLTTPGAPLVDAVNGRAYLLSGNTLYAYDTTEFTEVGRLNLGLELPQFTPTKLVRWGLDGFAILIKQQSLILVRWSEAIPVDRDQDHDGLPDRWEAQYFGTLAAEPEADPDGDGLSNRREYELGTSPTTPDAAALLRILDLRSTPAGLVLRYERVTLTGNPNFEIQQSPDLTNWASAGDGAEKVVSTDTRDGVTREIVEWTQPSSTQSQGFYRVRWLP